METSSADNVLESEQGTTFSENSKAQPSSVSKGDDLRASGKKIPSSISFSPETPLDDPFTDTDYELDKSVSSASCSPERDKVIQSGCVTENKPVYDSCEPKDEPSGPVSPLPVSTSAGPFTSELFDLSPGDMSVTDSPPIQVMDHSPEEPYRIPASVFAKSQSTNPADWSMASNESLFSIHMGNSFTKDNPLWPSGDLGTPLSVHQSQVEKSAEDRNGELRMDPEAEIMRDIRRRSEDQDNRKSSTEGRMSRISEESGNSRKSFAFPLLAGGADQSYSVKMAGSATVGTDAQQPKPKPKLHPQLQPQPQPQPKAAAATKQASSTKWFPCFSCCSSCS